MAALHFIIFRPMLDYLEDRDKARSGGRDEAEALQSRIAEKVEDYDARMVKAQDDVIELKAERRVAALAEGEVSLTAARKASDEKIQAAVAEIDAERVEAASGIEQSAKDLAGDIARGVLGRDLQAG